MLEMKMLICHFVQNLEVSFDEKWDPDNWERDMMDLFVTKKGRLPVRIALRHAVA